MKSDYNMIIGIFQGSSTSQGAQRPQSRNCVTECSPLWVEEAKILSIPPLQNSGNCKNFVGSAALVEICRCRVVGFYLRDVVSAVIATAMCLAGWLAGWVAVRHTPVLYQNG